jgi:TPP-dependent 2-oxoacid decarboxylase
VPKGEDRIQNFDELYRQTLHIHGRRKYADIADWDYAGLLRVLGDFDGTASRSHKVRCKKELSELLDDVAFGDGKFIQLVEIFMDKMDAPSALKNWPKPGSQPERPL